MKQTNQRHNVGDQRCIHTYLLFFASLALLSLGACNPSDPPSSEPVNPYPMGGDDRPIYEEGQSDFISASGNRGSVAVIEAGTEAGTDVAEPPSDQGTADRTVEEGDIYRVVRPGLMANLNSYRGLQLIDISNTSEPNILSRLPLSGVPVEMYLFDGYAVVMMNNWWGYWGARDDLDVESFNGGLVALINIQDPSQPSLVSYHPVPGNIQTSRLTRSMAGDALYVVAYDWSYDATDVETGGVDTWYGPQTILRSFSVDTSSASLTLAGELDLGGYVADIQATPRALLIARQQGWYARQQDDWDGTYVSLIDISDPSGAITEGASVPVEGYVRRKSDMSLEGDILRVVSADWSEGSVLSTWNVSDFQEATPIDSARFGENEDLYASLFMSDRAFFVTYRRVDPFHAFSISPEGFLEERTEYVISGWNDFFKPVFEGSALIGVGQDDQDEQGNSIAVSLYSTDLELSEPFLSRAQGDLTGWSWSEAQWDDRAFSVIENAVEVMSADGVVETGLVLLPFSGYDRAEERSRSGVQIFTFSETTVTARGTMSHNGPVRRSFEPVEGVVGNLSEASLSLYDREDPDHPEQLGSVDLAPEISRVFFVGQGPARHAVRLKGSNSLYYGWWYGDTRELEPAHLQVMAVGADVDSSEPIAEIEVPAFADVRQHGDVFVALTDRWRYDEENRDTTRDVNIKLIDLSDPTAPQARGELDLSELFDGYDGYYGGYDDWGCWDCGGYWWGGSSLTLNPLDGGLAISRLVAQEEYLGDYEQCWIRSYDLSQQSDELPNCNDRWSLEPQEAATPQACRYFFGGLQCHRPMGGQFLCNGSINACEATFDAENHLEVDYESCEPLELDGVELAQRESRAQECYEYEQRRSWASLELSLISLADLDAPEVVSTLRRPTEERFEGIVVSGDSLFYSYHEPVEVEGDELSFVRHFTRELNLSDLSSPEIGSPVNLPGRFLLKRGDLIVSRDQTWGPQSAESSLNLTRLNAEGSRALFVSRHLFEGRSLSQVRLDEVEGEERLVVTHGPSYSDYYYGNVTVSEGGDGVSEGVNPDSLNHVGIFRLSDLNLLGESVSDRWSTLNEVRAGRAIFSVGGGALIMDLSNPQQISAQAFLPINGWGALLTLEGDTLYAAAGRFGVYTLPLSERLILTPPL